MTLLEPDLARAKDRLEADVQRARVGVHEQATRDIGNVVALEMYFADLRRAEKALADWLELEGMA